MEGQYEDLELSGSMNSRLTFLAEGDRQAGDRGVLQSISVQVWGTSMVTSSREASPSREECRALLASVKLACNNNS